MLNTAQAEFVVIGLNASPSYYWRGGILPEVASMVSHVDDDTNHILLRVANTTTYDAQYAQMQAVGIRVKKAG